MATSRYKYSVFYSEYGEVWVRDDQETPSELEFTGLFVLSRTDLGPIFGNYCLPEDED